jgi:hypothetical protein
MVNVCGVPSQPFTEGVTVMVATTVVVPVLVAANAGIVALVPLAAKPILGVLFTQL